jgi:hypothetical protein
MAYVEVARHDGTMILRMGYSIEIAAANFDYIRPH